MLLQEQRHHVWKGIGNVFDGFLGIKTDTLNMGLALKEKKYLKQNYYRIQTSGYKEESSK